MEQGNLTIERKTVLSEEETKNFLRDNGVQPLGSLRNREPHQSILFVLNGTARERLARELPNLPLPVIARIDDPQRIILQNPEPVPGDIPLRLYNNGGQIAYYAISKTTNKIELVKTSNEASKEYRVNSDNLFLAADHLFPKASEVK